jgi:hypothetical protein
MVAAATASILKHLLKPHSIRPLQLAMNDGELNARYDPDLVLGLSIWHFSERENIHLLTAAIDESRQQLPSPLCVVYCKLPLETYLPILCESGAQLIVSSIPSLQRCLEWNVSRIPLTDQCFHPLISGLTARLPWSSLG